MRVRRSNVEAESWFPARGRIESQSRNGKILRYRGVGDKSGRNYVGWKRRIPVGWSSLGEESHWVSEINRV